MAKSAQRERRRPAAARNLAAIAFAAPPRSHRTHVLLRVRDNGHHRARPRPRGSPAGPFKPLDDDARSKVRAQMEFYFSDSNLPRDKFLRETVEADPEGFVDISLLATFSRMRALLAPFGGPHNDETVAALVDLLRTSAELTVSDDGKRVRAPPPSARARRSTKRWRRVRCTRARSR